MRKEERERRKNIAAGRQEEPDQQLILPPMPLPVVPAVSIVEFPDGQKAVLQQTSTPAGTNYAFYTAEQASEVAEMLKNAADQARGSGLHVPSSGLITPPGV